MNNQKDSEVAGLVARLVARSGNTRHYVYAHEDFRNDPLEVREKYERWLEGEVSEILKAVKEGELA
jgi:hypothetical protein